MACESKLPPIRSLKTEEFKVNKKHFGRKRDFEHLQVFYSNRLLLRPFQSLNKWIKRTVYNYSCWLILLQFLTWMKRINRRMKNKAVGQRFLLAPSLSPSFSVRLESKEKLWWEAMFMRAFHENNPLNIPIFHHNVLLLSKQNFFISRYTCWS